MAMSYSTVHGVWLTVHLPSRVNTGQTPSCSCPPTLTELSSQQCVITVIIHLPKFFFLICKCCINELPLECQLLIPCSYSDFKICQLSTTVLLFPLSPHTSNPSVYQGNSHSKSPHLEIHGFHRMSERCHTNVVSKEYNIPLWEVGVEIESCIKWKNGIK